MTLLGTVLFVCFVFEAASLYLVLAVLELAVYTRLALNLEIFLPLPPEWRCFGTVLTLEDI